MKKLVVIALALAAILLFTSAPKAQLKLSLGPQIGMTLPLADYAGEPTDYYNGTKYGLKAGFNFGAIVKANFVIFGGRLDVNYSMLKNDGAITGTNNGTADYKQNVLMIGVGPEYQLNIPMSPVKPYGSIQFLYSTFSGETTFQGLSAVNSSTNKLESASRIGVGFILGTEINLGPMYVLDINLRYNMLNAGSKEFVAYNNSNRINSYINLNDEADPNYDGSNHPIGKSRNISTFQLNIGFLFSLGL